jgi:hypothetical protein
MEDLQIYLVVPMRRILHKNKLQHSKFLSVHKRGLQQDLESFSKKIGIGFLNDEFGHFLKKFN